MEKTTNENCIDYYQLFSSKNRCELSIINENDFDIVTII